MKKPSRGVILIIVALALIAAGALYAIYLGGQKRWAANVVAESTGLFKGPLTT